ncbi:MAG: DUF4926 domain-containing protein [Arcicella sp.]|jgi:hypothetical protein|nr:DUF4926 domain-containing protein [Arcicella sp.]
MQKFPLYSQVILTKNFPQSGFLIGDVATIVDFIEPDGYILEIFDSQGNTLNVLPVLESDISLPKPHAVVNYREYAISA